MEVNALTGRRKEKVLVEIPDEEIFSYEIEEVKPGLLKMTLRVTVEGAEIIDSYDLNVDDAFINNRYGEWEK